MRLQRWPLSISMRRGTVPSASRASPAADQCIETDAIDHALIDRCRIFILGRYPCPLNRRVPPRLTQHGMHLNTGKLVSYDPNWRPALWNSTEQGIAGMKLGLPYTNILKLSEEELELLLRNRGSGGGDKKLILRRNEADCCNARAAWLFLPLRRPNGRISDLSDNGYRHNRSRRHLLGGAALPPS